MESELTSTLVCLTDYFIGGEVINFKFKREKTIIVSIRANNIFLFNYTFEGKITVRPLYSEYVLYIMHYVNHKYTYMS